jgi:protein associated with RNAse G/E
MQDQWLVVQSQWIIAKSGFLVQRNAEKTVECREEKILYFQIENWFTRNIFYD